MAASSNLLQRGSWGCSKFIHKNHAAGGGNSSIMVGMFVFLCLASQKPSDREFFVPARTHLVAKLVQVKGLIIRNATDTKCKCSVNSFSLH